MKAVAAANRTKGIKSFLPSTSAPTSIDQKVAAAEGWFSCHGPTRWTTLQPVVDKISRLWDVFAEYFSQDGLRILRDFFISETARASVSFLSHILVIFNETINFLQREKAILPELLDQMQKFREKIRERSRQKFYGVVTGTLLHRLPVEEAQVLEEQFQDFYKTTLDYVDNWFRLEHYPSNLSWIGLQSKEVLHEDVMELASQVAPEMLLNNNKLLREIGGQEKYQ
uniref:Uncharacterized protein n=1 Tax=Acrobeloides nanus TaxID=290746 RepID=A0A914C8Y5_9BILA